MKVGAAMAKVASVQKSRTRKKIMSFVDDMRGDWQRNLYWSCSLDMCDGDRL